MLDIAVSLNDFSRNDETGVYSYGPAVNCTAMLGERTLFKNIKWEIWDGSSLDPAPK